MNPRFKVEGMLFARRGNAMIDKTLHILLCDDSDDDRLLFKEALKKIPLSISLTTANDGEELMTYLAKSTAKRPDAIFLDLNMPRKNGFECLEEIKQIEALKNIPIIIFSTADQPDAISKTYKAGANLYIIKPSDFNTLETIIKKALGLIKKNPFIQLPKDKFVLKEKSRIEI